MNENSEKVLQSIKALPAQCLQAWEESVQIEFPDSYLAGENLVICGMGASGLPGHILTSVFQTKIPAALVNDYRLPAWAAGPKTLVSLSSYSGNTQETISCFEEAKSRGCLVTGATSGGELAKLLEAQGAPFYKYDPKHNSSGQPRMGLGYGIFGQIGIFYKLGILDAAGDLEHDVVGSVEALKSSQSTLEEASQNLAKQLQGGVVLVLAAEHLIGNAHTFGNQLNETAKNLASWHTLPEADHHLLEGLKNPKVPVLAVFLDSVNYSAPIKKRLELTKDIVEKNGHKTYVYKPGAGGRLGEVLEILYLSGYSTALLAQLLGEDPLEIPWVDYFKKTLQEPSS